MNEENSSSNEAAAWVWEAFIGGCWETFYAKRKPDFSNWDCDTRGLIPLYTAPPAQPVAVSFPPLEWTEERKYTMTLQVGRSLGYWYEVSAKCYSPGWIATRGGLAVIYDGDSEDDAKAACQADYEQRIHSALVIDTVQPAQEP